MTTKAARHARIVSILDERRVRSQAELAAALTAAGVEGTQATLSRDLDELGGLIRRLPSSAVISLVGTLGIHLVGSKIVDRAQTAIVATELVVFAAFIAVTVPGAARHLLAFSG